MSRFILSLSLIGSLFGCGADEYSWNERTTGTVQTPNGIVTGTSVIEFRATWCEDGCGFPARNYIWDYTGEGVVVEIAPDRYLFVLPQSFLADAHRYAPGVLGRNQDRGERLHSASRLRDPVTLPIEAYPDMLTFLDWGHVDSLREVDPTDMADAFGEGFEILSITLEVTRDQVSAPQIADLLRWTCEPRRMENGGHSSFQVPNDSLRGWYSVSNFQLGRVINICETAS